MKRGSRTWKGEGFIMFLFMKLLECRDDLEQWRLLTNEDSFLLLLLTSIGKLTGKLKGYVLLKQTYRSRKSNFLRRLEIFQEYGKIIMMHS